MALAAVAMLCACVGASASSPTDSLLRQLDVRIKAKPHYVAQKRHRIDSLSHLLSAEYDNTARFSRMAELFHEYKSFSIDTAVMLSRQCRTMAIHTGSDSLLWEAQIMEAEALQSLGRYDESLRVLDALPASARNIFRLSLLNLYATIYYSLYQNTYPRSDAEAFGERLLQYRDSLVAILPPTDPEYHINMAERYRVLGNTQGAGEEVRILRSQFSPQQVEPGMVAYIAAQVALMQGNHEEAKQLLAQSAIYDMESSTRKYEALPILAKMLYEDGDYERAYSYIYTSMRDIELSNARNRMQKITESLPLIADAHREAVAKKNRLKNTLIVVVSVLMFLLLIALLAVRSRHKSLKRERQALAGNNLQLTRLKEELAQANSRLADQAKVKEEYIGYLFNLCSEYIDTHERERNLLARKIKAGKILEVEQALRSSQNVDNLKNFFHRFDQIFLGLFPDFIDKMNSLLTDDYRLTPRESELLSPELRICALVRLGINDSTRIANFLHYSTQTVYNYRARIRSHARFPKDEFLQRVQSLD